MSRYERVLVTGAAGFVGSNLVARLLADGYRVTGLDNFSMGSRQNIAEALEDPAFRLVAGDIRDAAALAEGFEGAGCVIHLAAMKIPKFGNAKETLLANTVCTERILDLCVPDGVRLLIASTSDVYGMNPEQPVDEESACVIGSSAVKRWSYAVSKLFDEQLCFAYADEHGLDFTTMRFFNSYGPRAHRSWWGGPQSLFIDAALSGGTLTVHGDGSQQRCFTYASDLVDGIVAILESDECGREIVNLGNPTQEVTIEEMAELVCELCGRDPAEAIVHQPHEALFKRYDEVLRRVPDITKAHRLLGYEPHVTLRGGLIETVKWHAEHEPPAPEGA